ncbi:MAG: putative Ig domain-containing protein, partial [Planctomycetia bacterium]|nr:putative Ig domain-containing protein [Planctomycetia bacterium]
MTILNPLRRWKCSLLACLEYGRRKRLRKRKSAGLGWVEGLETRALLSAAVVQFDVSSVLNADVVVNRLNGVTDTTQTSIDRHNNSENYSLLTQTAAVALKPAGATANGLPDNGFISANAFHPDAQLAVSNANDGNNARVSDSAFDFTLNVPQSHYQEIHVFLTAGHGSAPFQLTLNYSGGTAVTSATTVVPDWMNPVVDSQSTYNLVTGMDREKADLTGYDDANRATIFGFRFAADPNKTLQSITLTPVNSENSGRLVFFGAAGVLSNSAPVLSAIPDQNINEQSTLTVVAHATDPDGNALAYSLDAAPSGATINSSTGVLSWTPTEAQGPGSYTVSIRVTDNGSPALSDVKSFHVTVNETNIAPTLVNPGDKSVDEQTPLNFTLSASDPDLPPNVLTYTIASGALPGMSLNPNTGAFSWTPAEQQDGDALVTFSVSDNAGGSDSKTISIHVNDVNQAPVLHVFNPPTVVKTTTLNFQVASATDSDFLAGIPNTLSYSLTQTGGPASSAATIDSATGFLTWTPSADQAAGDYTFDVAVDDNTGSYNSVAVGQITVKVHSAGIVNGDLLVVGTSQADDISVLPGSGSGIVVAVNSETYSFDSTEITGEIRVLGFPGSDTAQVSGAISHPFDIEEGTGAGTLIVTATDGSDAIVLEDGSLLIGGTSIEFAGESSLVIDALGGDDEVAMNGHAAVFDTTINGGTGFDHFSAALTGGFDSVLTLLEMESADITVDGDFAGILTSVEDLDHAPGSGVIDTLTVNGSITVGAVVDAGAIDVLHVTGNQAGKVIAHGAGTIGDVTVGGDLTGTGVITAVEDSPTNGSGTVGSVSIGGDSAGTIDVG